MSGLKLLKRPITYSFISSLVIVIPLILDVFSEIGLEVKIILVTIFLILSFIFGYFEITSFTLKINIENILELMVKSLYGEKFNFYRSNIMLYNKRRNSLKIHYSFNMKGHKDRFFEIELDKYKDLCASLSFTKESLVVLDAKNVELHNKLVAENKIWDKMLSVASVPIYSKNQKKVIGVLNIDSEMPLDKTEFKEQKKYIVFNAYSDIIKDTLG